ncbi:hypothetical protein GH5_03527 [Leishmania sp. Ghana 2012 LV757]|uniref:hypothetical protein n=1 Tax=Leishmania sp. Ghana 2012 LV757 TaxID=2803181 RepID=UPI001B4102C6|nr:hypothetical protein GH5_03527 [Leishmania sp. Ghana 2012 LV757]
MRVAAPWHTLGRQRRGAVRAAAGSLMNVTSQIVHGAATLLPAGRVSLAPAVTQLVLHDEMVPRVGLLLRSRSLWVPKSTASTPSPSEPTTSSETPAASASSSSITDEEAAAAASSTAPAESTSVMVHPSEGGVSAGAGAAAFCGVRNGAPSVVSSRNDISSEARLDEIVALLEEKRLGRQRKLFEDMLVFEGGAVADHPSLGTSLIMRDFVQFALYHNKWGYYPKLFRKYRQLMTTGYFDPIPFASLRSQHDYERYVAKLHESTPGFVTPTQLFQPYYGWVLAEYLITTHRAKFDPREPLIVYDIGAGTGALALSMLDYLAEHFPDLYATCEYHAVEQNPHLIQVLRNKLIHHYHHVNIHHLSVLNWRQLEKRRCVVLAVELFSGMPHDCVLWDQEAVVSEHWFGFQQHDNLATVHERYYALQDPIILRYLRYLNWMQEESFHNLKVLCLTGGRETLDAPKRRSIEPNMADSTTSIVTKMAYIMSPLHTAWLPTAQMVFLEMLAQYFPRHHLFAADWSSVRQALPGVNGPVLQVKLRVAKDIYLRKSADALHANAGMVDICFPTDFDHLSTVYTSICGALKEVESMRHPVFWQTHGGNKTALFTTRSGYNPLLEDFQQFHVFTSHHPPEL